MRLAIPYLLVLLLSGLWFFLYPPVGDSTEEALLELTRLTARTSVFFFIAAFSASALLKLTAASTARLMVLNRRHLGLSFALAHFIHLGVLVAYFQTTGEDPGLVRIYGGGAAYLMIGLMALTSNDYSQRILGRNWRRLHMAGSWYVWIVFLNSYLGRTVEGREPVWVFAGITMVLILVAALRMLVLLRAMTWFRRDVTGQG